MSRARTSLRLRGVLFGVFIVAAMPLFVRIWVEAPALDWAAPAGSDHSGLELDVRNALDGDQLVGTPSRLGVRNLGPAYPFWMAPWYALTGHGAAGMVIGAWVAHAAAIAVAVSIVWRTGGLRPAFAAALAIAFAWLRAGPDALSGFYNPVLTMPAVMVTTVAGAALSQGRWRSLPVAVGAATIGAQVHFAAAPGLVLVGLLAVVAAWRTRSRPSRSVLIGSSLLLVVLWMPTLADQVVGSGNLTRLSRELTRDPDRPDAPLGPLIAHPLVSRGARARVAGELLTLTAPRAAASGTLPGFFFGLGPVRPEPARTALAVVLLACGGALARFGPRRDPLASALMLLPSVGAAATLVTTLPLANSFFLYYFAPIAGYAMGFWIGVAHRVQSLVPPTPSHVSRGTAAPAAALALAAVALAVGAFHLSTGPVQSSWLDRARPIGIEAAVEATVEAISPGCLTRGVAILAEPKELIEVWELVVALDRLDVPATVPRSLEAFVGQGRAFTGREAATLRTFVGQGRASTDREAATLSGSSRPWISVVPGCARSR